MFLPRDIPARYGKNCTLFRLSTNFVTQAYACPFTPSRGKGQFFEPHHTVTGFGNPACRTIQPPALPCGPACRGCRRRPLRSGRVTVSQNVKSPAEAGLKDRGAEAPTVELLKPKLRRSTRRTGSRSRRRTHRCGRWRSRPWDSCPRCCGCRPATWRCRQHPA